MKKLEDLIFTYKDFPKKGIDFKDVLEILQYQVTFRDLILKMSSTQFLKNAEAIISIDARGFIFGTAVAIESSKPMLLNESPESYQDTYQQENMIWNMERIFLQYKLML